MESLNDEIRTTLQINITGYKQIRYVYYYTVQVTKLYSGEQHYLDKRYNQFSQLQESLKNKNYVDLPRIPSKSYIPIKSTEQLERRKAELTAYMKAMGNRRDIRNSVDFIKFLELDKFAPEVLIKKPSVIERLECSQNMNFYVTNCIFVPKKNVFVISLNDKYKRNSKLEVYSFKQTGIVRDSIVIKGGSMLLGENSSLKTFSLNGCLGRPTGLSLGAGINNSIDHGGVASENSDGDLLGPKGQKVEKLLEYLFNT